MNKIIEILYNKPNEIKLELIETKDGYYVRYGFAATKVYTDKDEAIKEGWKLKKELKELFEEENSIDI